LDAVKELMKKEEEKEEAEEKAKNAIKRAKLNEEQKVEFDKHIAEHEEEEAEHKKKNGLWVENKRPHDCDYDPNAKNPFASCRKKHPPTDNYQPYVGAAETDKPAKVEDTREQTKSRVHNIY